MDTNFVFPRPQPAVARPTIVGRSKPAQTISRESNALRASVLDAALELGIGTNPLVADWMFNNALKEEDEEESPSGCVGFWMLLVSFMAGLRPRSQRPYA
ncbi:hypothetical protein CPB84DRAFT_1010943 [Gymnopilus junonius]|uniref:Uncharacterized protein n=1 Tax=Gymnopilus junonius TaxID=109634 RepID=A0A9P5NPP3_GYMJU|nr:hypothetical protein CPB84DRAFT_1010943 [Gymnopilus junonius]